MTKILAWHSDPALKAEAVAAMTRHRKADEFIRGNYLAISSETAAGFRGCFHGCLTTEKLAADKGTQLAKFIAQGGPINWHEEGERLWGIPVRLGALLDRLFESLPEGWAEFAVASVEAMPVGVDLDAAVDRWLLDLLVDPEHGVIVFA